MRSTVSLTGENTLSVAEAREVLIVLRTHAIGTPLEESAKAKIRRAIAKAEGDKRVVAPILVHNPNLKLVR